MLLWALAGRRLPAWGWAWFGLVFGRVAARLLHGFPAGLALVRSVLLLHAHVFFRLSAQGNGRDGQSGQERQGSSDLSNDVSFHGRSLNLGRRSKVNGYFQRLLGRAGFHQPSFRAALGAAD